MKIYALGPNGTYGHEAAEHVRKQRADKGLPRLEVQLVQNHSVVFMLVSDVNVLGVVAIENSRKTLVGEVVDWWLNSSDSRPIVVGEITLPIVHCLLGRVDNQSRRLTVLSHEQALGQCSEHLAKDGFIYRIPVNSTGQAALLVSKSDDHANHFAISSRFAAQYYGLKIFENAYQDNIGNATRFHVLGHHLGLQPKPTGKDRTAVICWPKMNVPGVLAAYGHATADEDVQMSSVHSVGLGKMGEYAFYFEFDEHFDSQKGQSVMTSLEKVSRRVLRLGSYPRQ
jgi:chorismate mutase / prephenate dehydratase